MKKIPKKVMGLGGLITVVTQDEVLLDGEPFAGSWEADTRIIKLQKQDMLLMRSTYFHELAHAAFADSGISNLFTPEAEETLCDLYAMARMREEEKV